jgi:hypothetical protein
MIVCVCILALVIRPPNRIFSAPYYIVICGLSGFANFFSHYLINGTIFGKKLLNIKCVYRFSLQLFSETFLILGIIQ